MFYQEKIALHSLYFPIILFQHFYHDQFDNYIKLHLHFPEFLSFNFNFSFRFYHSFNNRFSYHLKNNFYCVFNLIFKVYHHPRSIIFIKLIKVFFKIISKYFHAPFLNHLEIIFAFLPYHLFLIKFIKYAIDLLKVFVKVIFFYNCANVRCELNFLQLLVILLILKRALILHLRHFFLQFLPLNLFFGLENLEKLCFIIFAFLLLTNAHLALHLCARPSFILQYLSLLAFKYASFLKFKVDFHILVIYYTLFAFIIIFKHLYYCEFHILFIIFLIFSFLITNFFICPILIS